MNLYLLQLSCFQILANVLLLATFYQLQLLTAAQFLAWVPLILASVQQTFNYWIHPLSSSFHVFILTAAWELHKLVWNRKELLPWAAAWPGFRSKIGAETVLGRAGRTHVGQKKVTKGGLLETTVKNCLFWSMSAGHACRVTPAMWGSWIIFLQFGVIKHRSIFVLWGFTPSS